MDSANGRLHTADYLRRLGVPELDPATTSFDPGYDPVTLEGHLEQSGHLMAGLKISMACWLIADEGATRRKVAAARRHGVATLTGGGPFEIAVTQGELPAYLDLCADIGFDSVECGEGFTDLPIAPEEVARLVAQRGLGLEFELGKKHAGAFDDGWVDELVELGRRWLGIGARSGHRRGSRERSRGRALRRARPAAGHLRRAVRRRLRVPRRGLRGSHQVESVRPAGALRAGQVRLANVRLEELLQSGDLPARAAFGRLRDGSMAEPARTFPDVSETVAIDFSPERATTHGEGAAIIAVDVIRATTTAVTGVVLGRDCYPRAVDRGRGAARGTAAATAARRRARRQPGRTDSTSTTARYELAHRTDTERPMILLSTSGTRLISAPPRAEQVYVACLRNWRAQAAWMIGRHERVVVLGAGTRGEFREEDQLCCAWIARELVAAGYAVHDERTRKIIGRWADEPVEALLVSHSVTYLRETGQEDDLEFVMSHVDDVDQAFVMRGNRLVAATEDGDRAVAGARSALRTR